MQVELTEDDRKVLCFSLLSAWQWYQGLLLHRRRQADFTGNEPTPLPPVIVAACEKIPELLGRLGWRPPEDRPGDDGGDLSI